MKMSILQESMSMVLDNLESSYTTRSGAGMITIVELNCFPILLFYCCDITETKDES